MTTITEYRVLLPDGAGGWLERTYKSLVTPSPDSGPYLSQEGDTFHVERIDGNTIYGAEAGPASRRQ